MSEFPSLPLFTDAYLADTRHLSAQEHGAYLLLLMMAWRLPDCRLPDDDATLAKWASLDARTWKRIRPKVMAFWTLADGYWTQSRLRRERDFVSKRAEVARQNGARGGRPKELNSNGSDNPAGSARVTQQKAPSPKPTVIEPIAQQTMPRDASVLERLFEAAGMAGFREERHPGLLKIHPVVALIEKGYSLEADILPVIRDKARNKTFSTWGYFTGAIIEAAAAKSAIPARQQPTEPWPERIEAWAVDPSSWIHAWGPKPDERGCRAPAELLPNARAA